MTTPLYRRLLKDRFDQLPAQVRELHDLTGTSVWVGRADVERGRSLASRMVATVMRLPRPGRDQMLRVVFSSADGREIWERSFNGVMFRSVQDADRGLMRERVGPSTFTFALDAAGDGMALKLKGVHFLGVPIPRLLMPVVFTFESEREGRYCFEVEASLPGFGLLVRYGGWLEKELE